MSDRCAEVLPEFIRNNYSTALVEVGSGRYSRVALALRSRFKVTATDILEIDAIDCRLKPIYVKDDVTCPDLQLYRGASLIYAIRPPMEIQRSIIELSEQIAADTLIKPLGSEIIEDTRLSLINFRGMPMYILRHTTATE
jgi:uncharacterized UPF0146 family protein